MHNHHSDVEMRQLAVAWMFVDGKSKKILYCKLCFIAFFVLHCTTMKSAFLSVWLLLFRNSKVTVYSLIYVTLWHMSIRFGLVTMWWRQQNSNLRPDPLEAVYRRTGPKTNKPEPFGSDLLQCGGDNRTRICDLPRVRRTLYRLSYASI